MINFQHKFIFIHITQTGGCSIERALGGKLQDHRRPRKYQIEHGMNIFDNFFTFTVVRNPWDKIVSHYCYQRRQFRSNLKRRHLIKDMTFTQYVDALSSGVKLCNFSMHQHPWLVGLKGNVVVDQVLRFENLQIGFDAICKKFNIDVSLPHRNRSRRAHYHTYYNNRTRDIVGNIFKKDIDLFDYKLDN